MNYEVRNTYWLTEAGYASHAIHIDVLHSYVPIYVCMHVSRMILLRFSSCCSFFCLFLGEQPQ